MAKNPKETISRCGRFLLIIKFNQFLSYSESCLMVKNWGGGVVYVGFDNGNDQINPQYYLDLRF